MTKFFLLILVLFLIVAAVYFSFPTQINEMFFAPKTTTSQADTTVAVVPTKPVITPTPTTAAEDDLTALDRDLSGLQASDTTLGQDLNNL